VLIFGTPLLYAQCTPAHLPLHSHGSPYVTVHLLLADTNSTVQTAGKVGHVHFFGSSLQVCIERRSSSERTCAGQRTVQTDSQTTTTYPRNSCLKSTVISKIEIPFSIHGHDRNSTHFANRGMSKIAGILQPLVNKVMVNQSRYRPGVAQRVPGS